MGFPFCLKRVALRVQDHSDIVTDPGSPRRLPDAGISIVIR
jgi:hypothetical protein